MKISSIQSVGFTAQARNVQNKTVTSPVEKERINKPDVMAYLNNVGKQNIVKPNIQRDIIFLLVKL